MKDFKHQLLDQLEDADILEEFKRRKLHDPRNTETQEPCNSQIAGPLLFFLFNLILIFIIYHFL